MKILIVGFILLLPVAGFSHSRLKPSMGVVPRTQSDGSIPSGVKVGPCGSLPRAAVPPQLSPGQKLTVTWEEVVDHPGRFEFYFSQGNDQNFILLATIQDTATGPLPHQYSTELTLPNVSCASCTLQMIQVMTENASMPTNYYSCADMILSNGVSASPTPIPSPAPSSSPTPVVTPISPVDCH